MLRTGVRRILTPFVVASLLVGAADLGSAIEPPSAAAIACTVVTPCYTLAIVMTGLGQVTVTATGGISCTMDGTVPTGTCSTRLYANTSVSLVAQPMDHTCTSMPAGDLCDISQGDSFAMPKMTVNYDVGVSYENAVNVSIVKAGTGSGRVVSTLPGIDCGSVCSAYQPGQISTKVTESPDAGSVFLGWSGGCVGTTSACDFDTGSGTAIEATFSKVATPPPPTPSPAPTPRPTTTPRPTSTPGPSGTPVAGPTPTPGPGHTAGPTAAPATSAGATSGPLASAGAGEVQTEGPAGASASAGASSDAVTSGASEGTSGPVAPAGSTGDSGIPTVLVIALVIAIVVVGAGGLLIGSRMGRRPRT